MNKYFNNRFLALIKKHKDFLFLTAMLTGISLFLYRHFIFGGRLYLFEDFGSDSVRVSFPTYIYFFDWIRNGMPFWSDKMGIGTSVLSHADIIFDPFTYLLFIFGKSRIIYMFIYIVVIKIILSGVFFWMFIGKYSNYKLSPFAKIIGAITYAFGGYIIVTGQNYVFATIYVYLPLILLGFEIWLHDKKKWLLILMLVLTALYFYYFFYMTAIFIAIYAVYRYFINYNFNLKHFFKYIFSLFWYGLLSLGLSAFYWMPSLALTFSNIRVEASKLTLWNMLFLDTGGDPGWPKVNMVITSLGRFLGNDILGIGNSISYLGYNGDYFQLALYCGIITVLLVPQIFNDENKRKKLMYCIFSIILIALLFIPFFTYLFNGFNQFTYRWTYVLHFSLALLLSIAINTVFERAKLNYKILFLTVGSLFIISLLVVFSASNLRVESLNSFLAKNIRAFVYSYFFIIAYTILTILFINIRYKKIIKIVILALVCIEMASFPYQFINDRLTTSPDPVKYKLGFFDNTNNVINYLKNMDSDIYRVDKSYDSVISEYGKVPSNNDALAQDFRGLKSYNANNQPNYIRFLQSSGVFVMNPNFIPPANTQPQDIKDANLNYINGVGNRYLLQSFLGVKYYLAKNNVELPDYFEHITKIDDITVYKNNNYLPLGFTFDSFITDDEFRKLNNAEKDLALLSFVVVGNTNNLSGIKAKKNIKALNNINSEREISKEITQRRTDYLKLTSYKDDNIVGEVSVSKNKILVLTIPYDEGWTIYVDGYKNIPMKVDGGLIGIELSPGLHIVQLKYFPPKLALGITISIITLLIFAFFNKKHIHKTILIISKLLRLFYKPARKTYDTIINYISKILIVNPKKSIFYVSIISGISAFICGGLVTRGYSFYSFFNPDKTNYFMDFYNVLYNLFNGPYTYHSIYPPLPLMAYRVILRLVPYDIVQHGALAIRSSQVGQLVFLFYTLVTLFAFFILIMEIKKGSKIEKYIFSLTMLFSAPFIFQFERANIIFVALLFLMIFVFFKDSKKPIIREIALISLAISVGIKLYPVLFGLLLIKEKRFKDLLRVALYCGAVFILPFFAVGGISQIPVLIGNISLTSNIATDWGVGYAVNILNITRTFFAIFGNFGKNPIAIGNIFSIIILALGIFSTFMLRSKWKSVAILALLIILVPPISYEYTLIYMIIPLILFLDNEEKGGRRDYLYLACFFLIFTPLTLNRIDVINNGFGRHLILPLTYGVLIQNLATTTMALYLIVQGLREQKAKPIYRTIGTLLLIFITKIYGTKFTGMKKYIFIAGKILLTILVILIFFGDAMFSDVYNTVKSSRPIYTILKPVEVPKDTIGPMITNIEPQYLHYIDKVIVTGTGFSLGRNKHAKFVSNYGEITPQYWSDNKFIFIVPLSWKLGNVKIWAEKPTVQNGSYLAGNKAEIKILDRLGEFNSDDIKYFAQIKYLDKETRDINDFRNYKLREYKFSRWIPTKAFQLYADIVDLTNFVKSNNR